MAKWRVAGVNFDHMHMGDLLRQVHDHPDAEIVGVYDQSRDRMSQAIADFSIPDDRVFTDLGHLHRAIETGSGDPLRGNGRTRDHVEQLAKHRVNILVEKPFAASVADARRMIEAMQGTGRKMAINWPLAWVASHVTCKRLIDDGAIGNLVEVHFYDGNRGPLFHLAAKVEVSAEEVERQKPKSWWYKKASGGGSLLDYLGYGATLGTWFHDGKIPVEVTSVVDGDARHRGRPAFGDGVPLRTRPVENGNALGDVHRSLDHPAAAEMRLRGRRHRRHHRQLRLRGPRDAADPRPARAEAGSGR